MSMQLCNEHNHLKEYICARNECNQLICKQCFKTHSQISNHCLGVKLSLDSKQFFLRWTDFILKKIIGFEEIVTQMGYSKIFEMKLQANHPKGSVSQLNFQDIQKMAIQALEAHKKITEGNLIFIQGTQSILQMIHPEFLKDLYNIAFEDARFNLANLLTDFRKKLIATYPEKEIYNYANFNILPKEIDQMEEERNGLVRQYEERIILRFPSKGEEHYKHSDSLPNSLKKEGIDEFSTFTDKEFSRDYHSSSQKINVFFDKNTLQLQENKQQVNQNDDNNLSTVSNPSPTMKQVREVDYTPRHIIQNISELQKIPSLEQLTTTISLLRSNQFMYQTKIAELEQHNVFLKTQLERLSNVQQKVIELEKQKQSQNHTSSEQKVVLQLQRQFQTPLKNQILELQKVQANLISENTKLNHAFKDMQDIAEGRSRTIEQLQQQINNMSQNIQHKQRSIQQLNQLISNQEEEISYRQNQVDILGQEIKKLMEKIAFLEKSIHQLNKLVSNQQQQISYRQNEVQNLQQEIKKLINKIKELEKSVKYLNSLIANEEEEITYRQNETEILQKQVKKLLDKIAYQEKSIHQLNNLIANEEQEINYRENQTQTLTQQVKKLIERIKELQSKLTTSNQQYNELQSKLNQTQQRQTDIQTTASEKQNLLQNSLHLSTQRNKTLQNEIHLLNEKYNFVETELTTAVQKNTSQEIEIRTLSQNNTILETELNFIKSQLINFKAEFNLTNDELNKLKQASLTHKSESINQQILEQVVILEAQLKNKSHDIALLLSVVQEYLEKVWVQQKSKAQSIFGKLKNLKTVNVRRGN